METIVVTVASTVILSGRVIFAFWCGGFSLVVSDPKLKGVHHEQKSVHSELGERPEVERQESQQPSPESGYGQPEQPIESK